MLYFSKPYIVNNTHTLCLPINTSTAPLIANLQKTITQKQKMYYENKFKTSS